MKSLAPENELPKVALLLSAELQHKLFSPEALEQLSTFAQVHRVDLGTSTSEQIASLLREAVVCITGWDTPVFSAQLLASTASIRFIAHTGGSVHFFNADALFKRGIRISHANAALAEGVAEFTILAALLCVRRAWICDQRLKTGHLWDQVPGKLLRAQRVGIVSVGSIGREVIARLKPFGCSLLAYDPYLTNEQAALLDVTLTDLDSLFATADIVSLHTPLLPTTRGMIGERQLSLLRDGAILVNTARAGLVDEMALMRELSTGRLIAALDVFHHEP